MGCSRMMYKVLILCLSITAAINHVAGHPKTSGVRPAEDLTNNLVKHFGHFESARHPRPESVDKWLQAREYVKKAFEMIGLETELHCFNTSVAFQYDDNREVEGCNIIGISKGSNDAANLHIIGAHFDSSGSKEFSVPLRDNGAGISLLIEVARAYEDSWQWKGWHRNYTTMFVAFDLNTMEQFPLSKGESGSKNFVDNWLLPKMQRERKTVAGAFILDSVSTYNTVEHTQNLPADFKTVFPGPYDRIFNDSMKGDFLAAVSPYDSDSQKLLKDFAGHYRMDRRRRPYRLQELVGLTSGFGNGATYRDLSHQASYHFWTAKPTLPAVLITDTGDKRVKPQAEQCTVDCNYIFANKERMQFLYSAYEALTFTLLDRQCTYVGLEDSGSSVIQVTSVASLLLSVVLTRVLM